MKALSIMAWVTVGGLGITLAAGNPRPDQEAVENELMRAKLANTYLIVRGLVQKDFRLIQDTASELLKTSESHEWDSHEHETYQAYREQLKRQSRKLLEQAGVRNLEGSTYAYLGVLSTCVDCHSHCRDVLMIATAEPVLNPIPTAVDAQDTVTR